MKDINEIIRDNASFVIFAAQPNEPHDVMHLLAANNVPFKVLLGAYKGVHETSYCVPMDNFEQVIAMDLVNQQESILVLGQMQPTGFRAATLVYLAEGVDSVELGNFVAVSREEAIEQDGYTFDPMGSLYFIVKQQEPEADTE